MSVIEESLVTLITGDGTVAGLIGARLYPLTFPQSAALPAVMYQRISGRRVHSHGGADGLARPQFQLVAKAATYGQVKAVSNAIREAIDGYIGTVGGVAIRSILVEDESDVYRVASEAGDSSYLTFLDIVVWHDENEQGD